MINKKLLFSVKECIPYIKKNVLFQWLGLVCNIIATLSLVALITNSYDSLLCIVCIVISIFIRMFMNQKAIEMSYASSHLVKETLRKRLYRKLSEIKNYTKDWNTSEIVQLSSEGVEQLESYFANYIPQFFYSMIAPLTLFIIVMFIDVKVAFILFICVPLIPMSIVFVQKFAKKLLNKYWGQYTQLGNSFLENLQGLTTLKIYQADQKRHEVMNEESENFRKITMRVLTMQLNSITIMDLVAYGGSALGIIFALKGNLSLFSTLFIILISAEFFIPMRLLGSYFHIAMNGMAAADKMFHILETKVEQKEQLDLKSTHITAKNLCFGYDEEKEILHHVNFDFSKGFVAFVGQSGSGKSTIASLLMSKYGNYTGSLTLDGKEIKDLDVFNCMTLIDHESYLFSGTLKDTLLMANQSASEEEMWSVLQKAGIDDFFKNQDGLDTVILEGGKNLSGGQRQRLAMARALLKDSMIYILDEATSNIDVESEDQIMACIHELSKSKLVICISHRLENVVHADQIYCIDLGEIVESGTHDELLQLDGVYAHLYHQQKELEQFGGKAHD